ncbi:hypothetical protein E1A91_D11G192600v1 [Gossypium mustelinum]|uniref:Uncharacterized protein n=1 Tax=Gossypium mustelinum TaxID=34275 RepID=A0A5D2SW27_GOSMU|nr:hypothetical protein E1A91_D11G192600v1 [Gossypium mustelinum]
MHASFLFSSLAFDSRFEVPEGQPDDLTVFGGIDWLPLCDLLWWNVSILDYQIIRCYRRNAPQEFEALY